MLERKFPNDYGRRERIEHTGSDGGPIDIRAVLAKMPPDQLVSRLRDMITVVERRQLTEGTEGLNEGPGQFDGEIENAAS